MNADGSPTTIPPLTDYGRYITHDFAMNDDQKAELLYRLSRAGFRTDRATVATTSALLGAKIAAEILGRDSTS